MTIGKGKYDDALSLALDSVEGQRGIFLALDGNKGSGFAVQGNLHSLQQLPDVLEHIANEMRKDLPNLT